MFKLRIKKEFHIEETSPCVSHDEPIAQVADLFAGLAVFSWNKYDQYEAWVRQNDLQMQMFPGPPVIMSRSEKERFPFLRYVDDQCKKNKMGISLRSFRGLKTINPNMPINFWLYESQSDEDKAPVRSR